jgi:hypothetical protein
MSDKIITLSQMNRWFDELEDALKNKIVDSPLADAEGRSDTYLLYQASQLLRARMLGDFSSEVVIEHKQYDN